MSEAKAATGRPGEQGGTEKRGGSDHDERALVDALFPLNAAQSELVPEQWKRLFSHLRDDECLSCQAYFEERRNRSLGDSAKEVLSDHEQNAIIASIVTAEGQLRYARPESEQGAGPADPEPHGAGASERGSDRARPTWSWAGWGLAAAACAALLLYPLAEWKERRAVQEKGGGVSADLFCVDMPGQPFPLTATDASCPPDAQIVAQAIAAPGNRLPYLTIIACENDFRCRLVSSSQFEGKPEVVAAGPRLKPGERLRIFAVWSDREIAEELMDRAAREARLQNKSALETNALPFVSSWSQMAYTVHARLSRSPQ